MWVFVRTSVNFAHLTSFQAIEFMDWHVPKTLDISVCQTSENKAFKMQHSLFCSQRRTRTRFNLIPSLHVFREKGLPLWPPQHGKKWKFEFGESTWKWQIEHTPMKGKWCTFIIWCLHSCVISSFIYQSEYVSMVRWVSTRLRSPARLWLLRRGGATTYIFLGTQPKI